MKTEAAIGLADILGKFVLPPIATLLLIAFIYVIWRTGSGHVMRHRIWRFAYGKEAIQDQVVRGFMEDRTSLMAFRYTAGIDVRSLETSRRLIEWLKQTDEDIGTIKIVGRYFDLEELKLKESPKPWPAFNGVLALACLVLILVASFNAPRLTERGYFTLKKSGQWFSATAKDVQSVSIIPWAEPTVLTAASCREKPAATNEFSADDTKLLCSFLDDPELKKVVAEATQEQLKAIVSLVTVFGIGVVWAGLNLRQTAYLADLRKRLEKRATQMSLNF